MNKQTLRFFVAIMLTLFIFDDSQAKSSSGLTMEEIPAKPAALGNAYIAGTNDIAAFSYNPGSLSSLTMGQVSFLYHNGIAGDRYGDVRLGMPIKDGKAGIGIAVGYYDGGDLVFNNGRDPVRTVNAQTDLFGSIGGAVGFGKMSVGLAVKYLSSELAETAKATAYAADGGVAFTINPRIRLGAVLQNFGTKLTYVSQGDDLPRKVGLGTSILLLTGKIPVMLYADAPYYLNEGELRYGTGLDISVGPLALRAGYKNGSDLEDFSLGTGFTLGQLNLDYAFGLVQELESRHRISIALKFGGAKDVQLASKKPVMQTLPEQSASLQTTEGEPADRRPTLEDIGQKEVMPFADQKAAESKPEASQRVSAPYSPRRIYVVKQGDTLGNIAKRYYGNTRFWEKIYTANRHIIEDARTIEPGQKIVLP